MNFMAKSSRSHVNILMCCCTALALITTASTHKLKGLGIICQTVHDCRCSLPACNNLEVMNALPISDNAVLISSTCTLPGQHLSIISHHHDGQV